MKKSRDVTHKKQLSFGLKAVQDHFLDVWPSPVLVKTSIVNLKCSHFCFEMLFYDAPLPCIADCSLRAIYGRLLWTPLLLYQHLVPFVWLHQISTY